MTGLLIKNAQLITMNAREEIIQGDLRIDGGEIAEIGSALPPREGERVMDATGRTVIPGFIQTHIHLCQTLFRGQADDLELMDWLRKRIWPLEAAHDGESVYYSALLGIGELISGGTTTIVDMETVHHTDYAFQAIAESGIRALSGKVMMDRASDDVPAALQEKTASSLQASVDLLEKWHGYGNGRIQYAFSPRFVISCTEPLLEEVRDLSARYGVKVHTHASENLGEIALVQEMTGMRNIVYLDSLGLANDRLILAHCVWLDEEEKWILQERRVHVSHCPGSNLKLASGVAETNSLIHEHQVSLSLGADGAPCNNHLDMFSEMRLAALIQKPVHGPAAMDAKTVFRMATIGGARAVGMEDQIGSLEVGKKADLAVLNLNQFHTFPSFDADPISRIVYSATSADVETTIIDGTVVMEHGITRTIDKAIVLREADRSLRRLLGRAKLAPL